MNNDIYDKAIDYDNACNDLLDGDILEHPSVKELNLNDYWEHQLLSAMEGSIPNVDTYGVWIEKVAEDIEDRRIDLLNNITLDTPLDEIGYGDCMSISNDLIDGDKAPNHLWPEAWGQMSYSATVEDLRDYLYELNAELVSEEA